MEKNTGAENSAQHDGQPGRGPTTNPLVSALVAEAARRSHTLAQLSKTLGVSYEHLAAWRRGDASIADARRCVHRRAAQYLGLPTILVLVMSGAIGLGEFTWPENATLNNRVNRELERLRADAFVGPLVPDDLQKASDSVKLFVVFLFHELTYDSSRGRQSARWLTALHDAAIANSGYSVELEALQKGAPGNQGIF